MATDTIEYHLARTFRSHTGQRHVTYRPDWSKETPWVAYYYGTTGLRFASLDEAAAFHTFLRDSLIITKD